MEKITVKICLGTACFVMGGAELQDLADIIPAKYGDKVSVEGSTCLELCSDEYSKAPYDLVNDVVVDKATKEKVLSKIEELLK